MFGAKFFVVGGYLTTATYVYCSHLIRQQRLD